MNALESLKSIFKDRLFKIPDYQRGYAWTVRQLWDFWEDVVNLPIGRFHYTGLLSLKKVDDEISSGWNEERWLIEDQGYKPFHVVDGQQRLTTFVIFVQAISELLQNLPENKGKNYDEIYLGSQSLKKIKEDYLVIEKPPEFIIRTYKFSYETDNPSFLFLRHRILNEPDSGTLQETFYTLNLDNAKKFFLENLEKFYKEEGLEGIEVLFRKVTQNLMFNLYEISDDFDVFVAFETMNNRGKKLSNLELLKNRLIYLTTLYDENELEKDDRQAIREKINNVWKEVYFQLGRNKKNPLNDDDFLVAHWIMYFQYTKQKGDDYIRFLLEEKFTPKNIYSKTEFKLNSVQEFEEIREEENEPEEPDENIQSQKTILRSKLLPLEIEDYVSSLKSAAVHWYNTHNPVDNPDLTEKESVWIERLNRVGILYFRPLVTVTFISPGVNSSERVKLFKAIERFIFVTFRMGRAFSSYGNFEFNRAARGLRTNTLSMDDIHESINNRMDYIFYQSEKSEKTFFDYTYLQKYLEKNFQKDSGGFYSWNGLRYFLYEYEMEKVRERGSQKIDWKLFVKSEKDKISIEHIFPQTPNLKCWKDDFKGIKKTHTNFLKGTLGNLLLLSRSINSSLQNDCFEDKKIPKYNDRKEKIRQGYKDGSHSEIEVSAYEDWNAETILDRGLKLLDFMERRWELEFESEDAKTDLLFLNFMNDEMKLNN